MRHMYMLDIITIFGTLSLAGNPAFESMLAIKCCPYSVNGIHVESIASFRG